VQAGRAGPVQLGRRWIRPVAFVLFFYFLNIIKLMQIQKFAQVSFELWKIMKQILLDRS
jgi:hypothetical protein